MAPILHHRTKQPSAPRTCRRLLQIVFGLLGCCCAQTSGTVKAVTPQYGQLPQDLANALVQMALTSHAPLIAELAQPLPSMPISDKAVLDSGTLNNLTEQVPGYAWNMEGKAVHFYNKKLRNAPFNFMNLVFPRFTTPPNLSDLQLWFPSRATGLLEGVTGEGGAISGFPDSKLATQRLRRAIYENVTPLQVLVRVADESPSFYAVIVFPSSTSTKAQAEHEVIWHFGSLSEKMHPIYTQPARAKGSKRQ